MQKALWPSKGLKFGSRKQEVNGNTLWNLHLAPVSKPTEVLFLCLDMESNCLLRNFFESQVRKKSSATYLLFDESIYANTSILYMSTF